MAGAVKKGTSAKSAKSVKKTAPKASKKAVKKPAAKKAAQKKSSDISVEITQKPAAAISEKDRLMAQQCLTCPMCKRARKKQKGFFFWFVKTVEGDYCPMCKAYERVYGKKPHEKI